MRLCVFVGRRAACSSPQGARSISIDDDPRFADIAFTPDATHIATFSAPDSSTANEPILRITLLLAACFALLGAVLGWRTRPRETAALQAGRDVGARGA